MAFSIAIWMKVWKPFLKTNFILFFKIQNFSDFIIKSLVISSPSFCKILCFKNPQSFFVDFFFFILAFSKTLKQELNFLSISIRPLELLQEIWTHKRNLCSETWGFLKIKRYKEKSFFYFLNLFNPKFFLLFPQYEYLAWSFITKDQNVYTLYITEIIRAFFYCNPLK